MKPQHQTIRGRRGGGYPISLSRTWGEASWTATDLVHDGRYPLLNMVREWALGNAVLMRAARSLSRG